MFIFYIYLENRIWTHAVAQWAGVHASCGRGLLPFLVLHGPWSTAGRAPEHCWVGPKSQENKEKIENFMYFAIKKLNFPFSILAQQ